MAPKLRTLKKQLQSYKMMEVVFMQQQTSTKSTKVLSIIT